MTLQADRHGPAEPASTPPPDALVYAVLDDIRNTLGMAWLDPAFRGLVSEPVFLTAAWSAVRPNVTRSFVQGSTALREQALAALQDGLAPSDHRGLLDGMSKEARNRLGRTARAVHQTAAAVTLVVQAWALLAEGRRVNGTGREEAPARRGVPAWQDGVTVHGRPDDARSVLDSATRTLGLSETPTALAALAPAQGYLERAWPELDGIVRRPEWRDAEAALRKSGIEALVRLPHPMQLQWDALRQRGLTEPKRHALAERLTAIVAGAPVNVLLAAYFWTALGRPEPTLEP